VKQTDNAPHCRHQVEPRDVEIHLPFIDLGQIEDVIDEFNQLLAIIMDDLNKVPLLIVQRGREQQLIHAEHPVHRGSDLMAHMR